MRGAESPPIGTFFDAKIILASEEYLTDHGQKKRRKLKVDQYDGNS